MEEIWKDIEGYEGLYQVSSYGRVCSIRKNNPRIMSPGDNGNGYLFVYLTNGKTKREYVHRLVASAFLPNPDGFGEVNHKDEDKTNNFAENLEWCTHAYNMSYGTGMSRAATKNSKPVEQLKDGVVVKRWKSGMDAARLGGFCQQHINRCCNGHERSHKGYEWRFAI